MKSELANLLFPDADVQSVYLASPFFSEDELQDYNRVIAFLRASGLKVYVPKEHSIKNAWDFPNPTWGRLVFNEDVAAIKACDAMLVLNFGMYSDTGTAWEQGFAFGMGKPVVSVLMNHKAQQFSLMMCNGCDTSVLFSNLVNVTGKKYLNIEQK